MMNMKQMLGEAGRSMSEDKRIGEIMARSMPDNEPRFEERPPGSQIFSIDAQIENLMKSYNMLVNAQEFGRAQEVADQIDQLQQQKISIQGMNARRQMIEDNFMPLGPPEMPEMPKGKPDMPISNRDRQIISDLLDSISE